MNSIKLSNRLGKVATFVTGKMLADIGSDHAYLPCFAIENGLVEQAIAGEIVRGPFESASRQVLARNLQEKIAVRLGDGLEVITHGEVDCITICGVGGSLIVQILEEGKAKLSGQERLILQPNIGAELVRDWLGLNGKKVIAEAILEEDGKIYEILVAETGDVQRLSDEERLFGPYLLQEQNPVFIKKWTLELKHLYAVQEQLNSAQDQAQVLSKQMEVLKTIRQIGALIGNDAKEK